MAQKRYKKIHHPYGPPRTGEKCTICGLPMGHKVHGADPRVK